VEPDSLNPDPAFQGNPDPDTDPDPGFFDDQEFKKKKIKLKSLFNVNVYFFLSGDR
jgi:hypothetical protein